MYDMYECIPWWLFSIGYTPLAIPYGLFPGVTNAELLFPGVPIGYSLLLKLIASAMKDEMRTTPKGQLPSKTLGQLPSGDLEKAIGNNKPLRPFPFLIAPFLTNFDVRVCTKSLSFFVHRICFGAVMRFETICEMWVCFWLSGLFLNMCYKCVMS